MEKEIYFQDYLNDIRLPPFYVYIVSILLGHACVIIASRQPYYSLGAFFYNISLYFFLLTGLAALAGSPALSSDWSRTPPDCRGLA